MYACKTLVQTVLNGGGHLSLRDDLLTYSVAAHIDGVLAPCVGGSNFFVWANDRKITSRPENGGITPLVRGGGRTDLLLALVV